MVPVRVLGVAVDANLAPVVLLAPIADAPGARTVVPIWVGEQEALSIRIALDGVRAPRPLSHDLMLRLLEATDTTVERVAVTRIEDGVFHAELVLRTRTGREVLDCRPSDAMAIAVRTGSPILVAETVLADAGVLEEPEEAPSDEAVAEFRRFLDDVDPEDFQG